MTDHDDHDHHDDLTGEEEDEHAISVQSFKIILIFVIFFVTLSGILPYRIPSIKKSESTLSYLNCFSAGMFLAIALIHMMPEAVEEHAEWAEENEIESPFPLPFCMMFVGYLIVLLVDRVIMHKFLHEQVGHHHHNE
jgi:zinc transporter 1/2/3